MINLKDVVVLGLALLGGLSDFNSFDIPYWGYIILLVVYAALRLFDRTIDVVSINKEDIGGGGIKRPNQNLQSKTRHEDIGGGGIKRP